MNSKNTKNQNRANKNKAQNNAKGTVVSEIKKISYQNPKISDPFVFKKREFIADIPPSEEFTVTKFEVNPGLPITFPWLSGIAVNFEKYKVRKLRFVFETAESTFIGGTVIMAPEFDVTDSLPVTKSELLEYQYATRSPVWKSFSVDLKVKDIMNYPSYYTRSSTQVDKKLYDPLYWIVATDGIISEALTGELWIEYEIEFMLPQKVNRVLSVQNFASFNLAGTSNNAPLLGGNLPQEGEFNVFVTLDKVLNFPSGFYGELLFFCFGTIEETNLTEDEVLSCTGTDAQVAVNIGTRLLNSSETINQVCYVVSIIAQPGGKVQFNNVGTINADNGGSGLTTWILMWNNTYIPAGFLPISQSGKKQIKKSLKK